MHGHGARGAYPFVLNHGAGRGIIIAEGCIIHSSSAAVERVFGYLEHEVVSRNVRLLTSANHRSRHDSYVERYLTTSERPIIGTGRVLVGQRTDGTGFPMELSVGEAERAAGRIFTGFIRDLTTQQRLELRLADLKAELIHVSRLSAMGTIVSAMAHDFKKAIDRDRHLF